MNNVVQYPVLERRQSDNHWKAAAVGERRHRAVPRIVLAGGLQARGIQAGAERARQLDDDLGIGGKGTVADHGGDAAVAIEHRREAQVDAEARQLAADGLAVLLRFVRGAQAGFLVQAAERAHRRNAGEADAEALHPPAFVIDSD